MSTLPKEWIEILDKKILLDEDILKESDDVWEWNNIKKEITIEFFNFLMDEYFIEAKKTIINWEKNFIKEKASELHEVINLDYLTRNMLYEVDSKFIIRNSNYPEFIRLMKIELNVKD